MGYSLVVLGDLEFPTAKHCADWRAAKLDGRGLDTPSPWSVEAGDGPTVDATLSMFESEWSLIERGETAIRLRASVDKGSDAFLDGRGWLVCAFRRAASFAGEGSLVFVGAPDYPGLFGVRVVVRAGASSFVELTEDEVREVENGEAYGEAQAVVSAQVAELDDFIEEGNKLLAARDEAARAAIANAFDIGQAMARLHDALPPEHALFGRSLADHPVVAALAARRDLDASAKMRERLAQIVGGPFAGAQTWKTSVTPGSTRVAGALACALWARGEAHEEIVSLWIESPHLSLRDHPRVRGLARPELDVRLAALLGQRQDLAGHDNHCWIVEALLSSDPAGAPARASALLDGDPRQDPGVLESLRWIVGALYEHPELNVPAWHEFVRRVVTTHPRSDQAYDLYDQIRDNAVGVMAIWKLPEALAMLTERFADFGVSRACELLDALGDSAAVPVLEAVLAKTKRRPDRAIIQKTIAALGGPPEQPSAAKKRRKK